MNDDLSDNPDEAPTVDAARRALQEAEAEAAALAPAPRAVCKCGAGPHLSVANRCANGHAIAGNLFRQKHTADENRRDQLLAEIIAEYKPSTLELRDACRFLANVKERLEHVKDGVPEHQRLMGMWTVLSTQLRTASSAPPVFPVTDAVTGAASGDELIARTTALLRTLLQWSQSKTPASSTGEDHSRASNAPGADRGAVPDTRALEAVTPQPERCVYCSLSPAQCAEIKVTRRETWQVLHYDDPACIAERSADATATMHRNIGKRSPWM